MATCTCGGPVVEMTNPPETVLCGNAEKIYVCCSCGTVMAGFRTAADRDLLVLGLEFLKSMEEE